MGKWWSILQLPFTIDLYVIRILSYLTFAEDTRSMIAVSYIGTSMELLLVYRPVVSATILGY